MFIFNSLYDLSLLFLGDLPTQFHFLYAIFTFVLSLLVIFILLSPFIILIRLFMRWAK